MLTRISPALAVANWVTTHSALFSDQMPIRSPRSSPSASSPAANASARVDQLRLGPAHALAADDQGRAVAVHAPRYGRGSGRSSRRAAGARPRRARSYAIQPTGGITPAPACSCAVWRQAFTVGKLLGRGLQIRRDPSLGPTSGATREPRDGANQGGERRTGHAAWPQRGGGRLCVSSTSIVPKPPHARSLRDRDRSERRSFPRTDRAARRRDRQDQPLPARSVAADGRARPARHHRRGGIRRLGPRLSRPLRGDGGDLARLGLGRAVLRRAFQPLRQPDPAQRHRRAERANTCRS